MADEVIDIVDEDNNIVGKELKSKAHRNGHWHKAIHIWIYNSEGEILLQRRALDKDSYPGMWTHAVGGHISSGEDPETAALREAVEEIDLNIKKKDLEFYKIRKDTDVVAEDFLDNEFDYVYLVKFNGSVNDLELQEEEVYDVKFISQDKLKKDLKENPDKYIPCYDYWSEMIGVVESLTSKNLN